MQIQFSKYQGTGNDFILIDNRKQNYNDINPRIVKEMCDRHFGIGADGLMLLENSQEADFRMTYYNSDGNQSSMCGNGGRCISVFAKSLGIVKDQASFMATDGLHHSIINDNYVELQMIDVQGYKNYKDGYIIDTGSPHFIQYVPNAKAVDVKTEGQAIRNNEDFKQEGININFTEVRTDKTLFVTTYERGVEDETLSCGTGVTAAALIQVKDIIGQNYVRVQTKGGTLMIKCVNYGKDEGFKEIWLCGDARFVFNGIYQA
jgi:diaminopimelate epimerase